MIIAPDNFRDEELFVTKNILEKAGFQVEVAAKKKGLIKGVMGGQIQVEKDFKELNLTNYQALVFIGGPGTRQYFTDQQVLNIAQKAAQQQMLLAAICIAPVILGNAGLLVSKKATVWSSTEDQSYIDKIVQNGQAIYTQENVVVDDLIITANGPAAAPQFARAITKALK